MPLKISVLLVAFAAMLWGSDLLLRPQALSSGWSPAWVVLGEHLLLTAAFAGALWRGRAALARLGRADWAALLFVAWGGSALATFLYTKAFTLGVPLPAVLLQKTQPIFALVGAWLFLGERRRPGFWVWCILALAGTLLLSQVSHVPSWGDVHFRQAACALGAAALWGGATVAGRRLTPVLSPPTLAGARFALAVPALAALAFLTRAASASVPARHALPAHASLFLLLIVLLPDLLGMGLYYIGLRGASASAATLAELCFPLTALLIGLLVQHDTLAPMQWAGFLLLLAAVLGLSFAPGVQLARAEVAEGRV